MARKEEDREDLYAEFRSAVRKWELQVAESTHPIIFGIRKDGRYSVYFDQDHCYHFNGEHELMRAYHAGALYRTQQTTLAKLTRERTPSETVLHRVDLNDEQLTEFLNQLRDALLQFLETLNLRNYQILRTDPLEIDTAKITEVLRSLCESKIELAPAFATRRK